MPLFVRPSDYRAFLAVIREGLARDDIHLLAYCVLANHWHLVVEPRGTNALVRFMHWVTVTHAVRWHHHHRTVGGGAVYQGRYHSVPLDSAERLMRACRYVERNALAARLVRRAQDWPWGSLSDRVRGVEAVPLKAAPFFASTAWIDYVNDPSRQEELVGDRTATIDWRDVIVSPGSSSRPKSREIWHPEGQNCGKEI